MYQVVFAVNDKYVPMLSVAIMSLLNTIKVELVINILFSNLSAKNRENISIICKKKGAKVNFLPVDRKVFFGLEEMGHLKIEAYYRMAIPDLISADRALYLDCDILFLNDVSELFDISIEGFPVAAVEDPDYQPIAHLGMSKGSVYFNSGIMLMNLEYWRSSHIADKTLLFLKDNPEKIKYADQCALNHVLDGNFIKIDKKYNFQTGFIGKGSEQKNQPSIVHFTGSIKPTNYLSQHPYKSVFMNELKNSKYYNVVFVQNFLRNILVTFKLYPITNFIKKTFNF